MGKPGIDKIEAALIDLIQGDSSMDYVPDNQVLPIDAGVDFNTLEVIIAAPAVLIQYDGATYAPTTADESAYQTIEHFTLVAVAQDLAGRDAAKRALYSIIEDLKSLIVQNRRMMVDTDKVTHMSMLGVAIFENLFYKFGMNAYGLQIQIRANSWEYSS